MHYILVFKSKLRPGIEVEYGARGEQIYQLAVGMPGFLSASDYVGDDGARVSIVEFDTLENLTAWRDHAEHKKAQQEGRDSFYASYSISIAKVERTSDFDAATKTWTKRP